MKALALLASLIATAAAEPFEGSTVPAPPTAANGLGSLLAEGHELHPSLKTHSLAVSNDYLPSGIVLPGNPHASTDTRFVEFVARAGSQGNLSRQGIRSVLYALHDVPKVDNTKRAGGVRQGNLGLYGLEAASAADADRWEAALRAIWAKNISLDCVRIHREGLVLVVVWASGFTPEYWNAVNTNVVERLDAHSAKERLR